MRSTRSRFWNTPPESTTSSSPLTFGDERAGLGGRPGEGGVEAGADPRRLRAGVEVGDDREHGLARIEITGPPGPGSITAIGYSPNPARPAARLELARRLALVADPRVHAAEGGDRVEEPPGARGQRRVDPGGDQLADPVPAPRVDLRRASGAGGGGRSLLVRGDQPGARHPPRLARRGVAAREPHRVQEPRALVSRAGRRPGARRPRPCRRARSRCRRRSPRPPGRARRARRGRRRGERGGAGPRAAPRPREPCA